MSRECVICHGASYGFTVRPDEEGKTVTVHMTSCASILSERRQKANHATPSGKPVKKAGISMWVAEYGDPEIIGNRPYGPAHKLPCNCPQHKREADDSSADLTWDHVLAKDPDIEYQ